MYDGVDGPYHVRRVRVSEDLTPHAHAGCSGFHGSADHVEEDHVVIRARSSCEKDRNWRG